MTRTRGRKHLRRLDAVYDGARTHIFFVTCCVEDHRPVLATQRVADALVRVWRNAPDVYGWLVGRYVIMPDHVHFFAAPRRDEAKRLSIFVGGWKR